MKRTLYRRFKDGLAGFNGTATKVIVEDAPTSPENLKKNPGRGTRSAVGSINDRQIFRNAKDIRSFEIAVTESQSQTYDREELHEIYRQIVLEDTAVVANWTMRKMKVLKRGFGIFKKGDEVKDDDMTALFFKTWFFDFLAAAMETKAWGFVCIELIAWNKEMQEFERWRDKEGFIYNPVQVINHDFVKPETGQVVTESSLLKGIDIFSRPDQLIFCGDDEHGFLYKLAKPTLFKQNAIANWSEWISVFGMDTTIVKSDAEGSELTKLIQTLRSIGSNRMGVLDKEDEYTTVGAKNTDAFNVFKEMMKYQDEGIAKIIFGQDVISNNTGQVVGNVGENVANDFSMADAKFLEYTVNNKLFPLMTRAGYLDLSDFEFRYDDKMSLREMKERAEVDEAVTRMGFTHDVDQINERYGVNVETRMTAPLQTVEARLKKLYPIPKK